MIASGLCRAMNDTRMPVNPYCRPLSEALACHLDRGDFNRAAKPAAAPPNKHVMKISQPTGSPAP